MSAPFAVRICAARNGGARCRPSRGWGPAGRGAAMNDRLAPVNPARAKEPHMDLGLKGQAALVTGGSKGIGRAVARGLAQEGVKVAICARSKAALEETAQELARATGAEVFGVAGDLTRPDDGQQIVDATVSRLRRI